MTEELGSLIHQLSNFITTKTVVGEPIHIDDTILVPLIDVSFGAGAGGTASNNFVKRHKEKEKRVEGDEGAGGSGLGAKITPSAMLVIQNGTTQLINIRNQDSLTKIIDMVPGLVSRVTDLFGKGKKEETIDDEDDDEALMKEVDTYHELDEK